MIISCDWGTSSFRLRLVDFPSANVLSADNPSLDNPFPGSPPPAIRSSLHRPTGISAAFSDWQRSGLPEPQRADFYRAILRDAIDELQQQFGHSPQGQSDQDLRGIPVVISGMASSSIGMLELPYHPIPFSVTGEDVTPTILPATADFPHAILLMPGIRSENDVMRGEETQLIGCDADKAATCLFIVPGTHSKHIAVIRGEAVGFQTFMTGEFFALLSGHSILAASVEDPGNTRGPAFLAGVDAARRSGLLNSAFSVRTNQLLAKWSKQDNYQYLSGLLIGEELKAITTYPRNEQPRNQQAMIGPPASAHPITLVAAEPLLGSYLAALGHLGFTDVMLVDADQALVQGHCRLFERHAAGLKI